MSDLDFRRGYPLWVRLSLWGSPTRTVVWVWCWLCVALGVVSCTLGAAWRPVFYLGALWFLGALVYWLAIRWVDRHGRW
jgi:hypothetical protein